MKNVQVIDGADNCTYDVFSISDDDFVMLFPIEGQDVEFADEFFSRAGLVAKEVWLRLWRVRANKKILNGIHGTVFCGLELKKRFYPTKREDEMVTGV